MTTTAPGMPARASGTRFSNPSTDKNVPVTPRPAVSDWAFGRPIRDMGAQRGYLPRQSARGRTRHVRVDFRSASGRQLSPASLPRGCSRSSSTSTRRAPVSVGTATSPCSRTWSPYRWARHAVCGCVAGRAAGGSAPHRRCVHAQPISCAGPYGVSGSIASRPSIACVIR